MMGKRFVQFGWPGMPDIVAIVKGVYVGIEVKSSTGKQSEDQKTFEFRLKRAGGIYILARSLEDIKNLI